MKKMNKKFFCAINYGKKSGNLFSGKVKIKKKITHDFYWINKLKILI